MDADPSQSELLDDFWRRYAASYDKILPLAPFYQLAVWRHVSAITALNARRVLDVGCATGNVAVPVAFAGADVVALDSSRAMLDRAAAKAAGCGVEGRMRFMAIDAQEAAYDEPFDAVNYLLALFCMSNGRQVLTATINALRIGGLAIFTEPTRSFQEEPLLAYARRIIFEQLNRQELADDWEVVANAGHVLGSLIRGDKDAGAPHHKIRADELPSELQQLGCTVIAMQESHLGQCRHIVACKNLP